MSENADTVGFIGLGNMGTPMVRRLADSGIRVQAFDVSPEARARAAAVGAVAVESSVAAARDAGAVILMLPNSEIVRSVVDELIAAHVLDAGSVVIDMSSSEPSSTRTIAEALADVKVDMVDAPVSGGVKGATNGTLTIMAGGEDTVLERVRPILVHLGKVVRAGSIGAGHAVKALNNLLSATHLWVTSEAIEAGKRFGLNPEVMLDVFNGSSGRSGSTENKWPNFILTETYDSGFGLRLMLKDMRIAVGLAAETGSTSVLGQAAVERWARASEDLAATADHTEVARWIMEHPVAD